MEAKDQNKQEKENAEETKKLKAAEENLNLIPQSNKIKCCICKRPGCYFKKNPRFQSAERTKTKKKSTTKYTIKISEQQSQGITE